MEEGGEKNVGLLTTLLWLSILDLFFFALSNEPSDKTNNKIFYVKLLKINCIHNFVFFSRISIRKEKRKKHDEGKKANK